MAFDFCDFCTLNSGAIAGDEEVFDMGFTPRVDDGSECFLRGVPSLFYAYGEGGVDVGYESMMEIDGLAWDIVFFAFGLEGEIFCKGVAFDGNIVSSFIARHTSFLDFLD